MKHTRKILLSALRMLALLVGGVFALCRVEAAPSLSDALDAQNLIWTTGGNALWFGQTAVTHDGTDAAQSGIIADAQQCSIQTTLSSAGTLSFWWKASSEMGYDELQFLLDDVEQYSISGEAAWAQLAVSIPAGNHTVKWQYVKDFSGSEGQDRAWLDQVSFTSSQQTKPVIDTQPAGKTVAEGCDVTFSVTAHANPDPSYQWCFNGLPIGLATNCVLTLLNVTPNQNGPYTVIVSNNLGAVTSAPAVLLVTSLSQALDTTNLLWTTGGDAPWFLQTVVTHDLRSAAESGAVTNNQLSWVQTVVDGPGTISFWWQVSSEPNYDGLQFLTNSVVAAGISGTNSVWERKSLDLPPGSHNLRWCYLKDGTYSMGRDKGWLDEVSYVPKVPAGVSVTLNTTNLNENDIIQLSLSFTNADPSRLWWVQVEWADGASDTLSNTTVGLVSMVLPHRFLDDQPSGTVADSCLIRVAVTNAIGGVFTNIPVQISNVAPLLNNLLINTPVFPREPVTLSGLIADPGSTDTFTLLVNWGDSVSSESFQYSAGTRSFSVQHQYMLSNTNVSVVLTLSDDDLGTNSVRLNLAVLPDPTPARFLSITQTTNSQVLIGLGTPGANYQIQASQDLKQWTNLGSRIPGTNQLFQFEDSVPPGTSRRFYRAQH